MSHAQAKVAVVYHSGYGHTAVLAEKVAEGVRESGAEAVLLKVESAGQDFDPLLDAITEADAVVFGAPTYMGDVSAVFKAFIDATSKPWFNSLWKDKLAGGFTTSHRFSGDKVHALTTLAGLAAQHGMNWVSLGLAPPGVTAAERGPDTLNRVGAFLGLAAQSDHVSPELSPPAGDRETARLQGLRIGEAALRWKRGAAADLAQAA